MRTTTDRKLATGTPVDLDFDVNDFFDHVPT